MFNNINMKKLLNIFHFYSNNDKCILRLYIKNMNKDLYEGPTNGMNDNPARI